MARHDDLEAIRRRMDGRRWLWIERPTLLHDRAPAAGQCPCGCESWSGEAEDERAAWLVETIPGPELLIDRWTGARRLRSDQSELDGSLASFDRLKRRADLVEHLVLPRRCYGAQLVALEATPKVKGIFGGVRGGKTQTLAEEAVDQWIAVGGRGVRLWWVAPELADTMRAVRKLVTGEAIKGGRYGETRPALLPPEIVADHPSTLEQIKRRKGITLVDGTEIELRYAGRGDSKDGGNLKGDAPAWIGVDEGAEIMSSVAWHTMIQRTTDSGGRLTTATTPKVGSPLKHLVFDEGTNLASANDGVYLTGYVHLSMLDNPWIARREAQRTIDTLSLEPNGADLVKQDVEGQWLTPGQRMWEHFDEDLHVIDWHRRDLEGYEVDGRELVNITPQVAASFFTRTTARSLYRIGGQDFNLRGHVTVIVQIWCPVDADAGNPAHWVVFVEDVVVKAGEPGEAARFLRSQAGAMRGLPHDYFAGLAIACDSTGAQDRPMESATGNVTSIFTSADEYVRAGFDVRPCHRSEAGKPINPEKPAQQAILHRLMRVASKGQQGPRYAAGERGLAPSVRLLVRRASCPELVKGLREQSRNERGFLRKRSDTLDDRLSDPVDALLYVLWAVYSDAYYYPRAKVVYE